MAAIHPQWMARIKPMIGTVDTECGCFYLCQITLCTGDLHQEIPDVTLRFCRDAVIHLTRFGKIHRDFSLVCIQTLALANADLGQLSGARGARRGTWGFGNRCSVNT